MNSYKKKNLFQTQFQSFLFDTGSDQIKSNPILTLDIRISTYHTNCCREPPLLLITFHMKLRINAVQQLGGILGQYEDAAQYFHGIPVRIVTWSFRHTSFVWATVEYISLWCYSGLDKSEPPDTITLPPSGFTVEVRVRCPSAMFDFL